MRKFKLKITIEELEKLNKIRQNSKNKKERQKAGAIYFRYIGKSLVETSKIVGISIPTIVKHIKIYIKKGKVYISENNYKGHDSKLEQFSDIIISDFNENPPRTIGEAKERIKVLTGIVRGNTQVAVFLKKKGFSYKKSKSEPAKADKEKQQEFVENTLDPLLESAENDDNIKVYFIDAVHIIWGAMLGYCWCILRQVVKSAYGRKRFNVLGALDSKTNETIVISNDSYISAQEVIKLFEKIREINGEEKEIYVVLDNARYQKCKVVYESAEKNKINLKYLPTYSPNLNLIERLWKFLRNECLNNKYHLTFKLFSESILGCLSKTHTEHKEKLSTLLSHKFEIFKTK